MQKFITPPWSWAVLAMVSIQLGAALSHPMLLAAGPEVVTWLRLAWAAVIMMVAVRPWAAWREVLAGRAWGAVALGASSGLMTSCYFESLARVPQGMANAIELLGPLGVAVLGSRRRLDFVWVALAGVGVVLLVQPGRAWHPDVAGVAWALCAAVFWGGYIVLTKRVGMRFAGFEGVAISLCVAALVTAPAGFVHGFGHVRAVDFWLTGGIALLIPVLPYVLELAALRRLSTRSFGILMSAEPAVAGVMGLLVLGEVPGVLQVAGFVCVIGASVGTLRRG